MTRLRLRLHHLPSAACGLLLGLVARVEAVEIITLEQAYDRALAADQSIQRAYWEIRKARLEPLNALTRLGPNISGNAGLGRASNTSHVTSRQTVFLEPTTIGGTGTSTTRDVTTRSYSRNDSGSLGVSYQQTLLDLGVIPAFRLGRLTSQAARLTYRATIRDILFELAQTYYEVLKQQRIVIVARETLKLAEEQLALARDRSEVGEVTLADVLRAQVTVEGNRQTFIEAENTLLSKRNLLANILNIPTEIPVAVVEPSPSAFSNREYSSLFAQALEHRDDLRVKAIAIEQDVQRRNGVIAEYTPRVVGQLNADRNNVSGSADSRSHSWDASLAVQVPFFTGGQREIALTQAGFQIQQTRLDYELYLESVQQDVKDAFLRVRTLEGTLKAVHVQVESAQQAYENLRAQYAAGVATSVDVLSALNDLNTARRDLATQTYDYQVALRSVENATGVFQARRIQKLKFR
jgi:outer membrane protein